MDERESKERESMQNAGWGEDGGTKCCDNYLHRKLKIGVWQVHHFNMLRKSAEMQNDDKKATYRVQWDKLLVLPSTGLYNPNPENCDWKQLCLYNATQNTCKHSVAFSGLFCRKLLIATMEFWLSPSFRKAMSVSVKLLSFGFLWLNAMWMGPMTFRDSSLEVVKMRASYTTWWVFIKSYGNENFSWFDGRAHL